MKTKLYLILASLAMAFSVGAGVASTKIDNSIKPVEAAQHADNYSSYTYSGNYYSSAFSTYTEGLNGTLRTNLTTLIHPTSVPEYSSGLATHLQQADADPTNSSNMVYLYTRDSVKKNSASSWNREHVWPKALSNSCWKESRAGADMLHLRPTYSTPNSTRSSYKYGEVTKNQTNLKIYNQMEYGYYANNYFMPLDATKGDVARICMYIWVAYYNEYGNNLPSLTNVFQSFDVLMTWHTNDRPDVLEGNRNDYAQNNVQYNRNPFVDHPEYAWKIFGSQCSESVLNAAKAAYPDGDPVGITSISKSSATMAIGDTTTISATSSNSASITWTSDDESVTVSPTTQSSGSNVTLTAVSEGTANITASVTISGKTYSATCVVTVTSSGGGEETDSYQILNTDFGSYDESDTEHTTASGLKIHAYYVMDNDVIQFKKSAGYIYNSDSLALGNLTISGISGSLTVYAGSTMNPDSNIISGSNGVYNLTGYTYFKIINSSSSVATCSGITVGISQSSKTLSSISVETAPNKVTYTEGDNFDPTGLVIRRTYSDSSYDTYTYANHNSEFSFDPTLTDSLTTTDTSVTITYSEKTCSQTITVNSSGGGGGDNEWVATEITSLTSSDVFVIVGNNGSNYAMSNGNGTSSAPSAVAVTVSSDKITSTVSNNMKWNLNINSDSYTFLPDGSTTTWLYASNANNGVRVGTDANKNFTIKDDYIFNTATSRYLGIYNSQDWRCYTTIHANIQNQTFKFYKFTGSEPEPVETYSVTYNKNTTDSVSGMPQNITNIESGGSVTLTGSPTRDGYTFAGWSLTTDGETISSISNITENKNVYAIWQENVSPTPSSGAVNYYKLSSTDSITSGRYVIAVNINSSFYGMIKTVASSKIAFSDSLTVTNGMISSADGSSLEYELNVTQDGVSIYNASNEKYIVGSTSNTSISVSTSPFYWSIGTPVRGSFRLQNSGNRGLIGQAGSTYKFGSYAVSNVKADSGDYYDIELFRGYTAEDYATEFNSNITCNVQGSSTPSFGTGYSWSIFESNYTNKLTSDQKSIISGATYTKSGSGAQTQVNPGDDVSQNVANCVAKYDYIVGKYNPTLSSTSTWKDFIDRKPAPVTSGRISLDVLGLTAGNATTIIVVISIIGVAALGGYIFIRKRKEI